MARGFQVYFYRPGFSPRRDQPRPPARKEAGFEPGIPSSTSLWSKKSVYSLYSAPLPKQLKKGKRNDLDSPTMTPPSITQETKQTSAFLQISWFPKGPTKQA